MKIIPKIEDLSFKGIYSIKAPNEKLYIGSTHKSFAQRLKTHLEKLNSNQHPNIHLQNSINKYGIDNFEFDILEIAENNIIEKEKHWIEFYKSYDNNKGFNIIKDPSLPIMSNLSIREKMRNTIKNNYIIGKMKPNNTVFKKGIIPWNKGKSYKSTDHLKVPKKTCGSKENLKNTVRNKLPEILVYDINNNFLGKWRSAKDIEEFSLSDNMNLPAKSRFKNDRMGKPKKLLQSVNINKSCKTGKPYKNLIFKTAT